MRVNKKSRVLRDLGMIRIGGLRSRNLLAYTSSAQSKKKSNAGRGVAITSDLRRDHVRIFTGVRQQGLALSLPCIVL